MSATAWAREGFAPRSPDGRWLYACKPAALPTMAPHRDPSGDSLLRRLLEARPEQAELPWPRGFEGGILHRLDTRTSGLVVIARDLAAFQDGRAAFASHLLRKTYRFLTARDVPWQQNVVEHDLAHHPRDKRRMVWRRGRSTPHRGRWLRARTELRRLGRAGDLHLWQAVIGTGVMHQIRLHAASVGLPLAGDRLYGGGDGPGFWLHHDRIDGWLEPCPTAPLPERYPR